jgi:hypothetical protein
VSQERTNERLLRDHTSGVHAAGGRLPTGASPCLLQTRLPVYSRTLRHAAQQSITASNRNAAATGSRLFHCWAHPERARRPCPGSQAPVETLPQGQALLSELAVGGCARLRWVVGMLDRKRCTPTSQSGHARGSDRPNTCGLSVQSPYEPPTQTTEGDGAAMRGSQRRQPAMARSKRLTSARGLAHFGNCQLASDLSPIVSPVPA